MIGGGHLKKLSVSLRLKRNRDGIFVLPSEVRPTLEVVGPLIIAHMKSKQDEVNGSTQFKDVDSAQPNGEDNLAGPSVKDDASPPRRRVIGPEMPPAELLVDAAKLTEAQAVLRAVSEEDTELFVGPPPPYMVAEAESANEAERFEEVVRIMDVEGDSPYDVVGVNHNMSAENIKRRYWKMSPFFFHPDKCSHPQAQQEFIKLNKALKICRILIRPS